MDTHTTTLPAALPAREQLERLRARINLEARGIGTRIRAFEKRAEEHAKAREPGRGGIFGRGASTWTKRQERWFQAEASRLFESERSSLLAALARYDRLVAAEARLAARLRLNEPWLPTWHARASVEDLRRIAAGESLWGYHPPF
jgi:hypothetical protein